MTVYFGSPIFQININNAFFNDELKENVYMSQPQGFIDSGKLSHICKLVKALYRLK